MILAKKVRLYPSEIQEQKLWQSVGTARFIYNWTLSRQEENYKNGGKFISDNELRKEITQLKKDELSWLNKVSNNVAKQAVKDGCDTQGTIGLFLFLCAHICSVLGVQR